MKLYFSTILTLVVGLSGCGAMMDSVALYHDRQDSCQSGINRPELGRPPGYQVPAYCRGGSRTSTTTFYTNSGVQTGRAVTKY